MSYKINYMYGDLMDDTITISRSEYDELVSSSEWLSALEDAGVDNWDGIELAQDIYDRFKTA